MSQITSGWENSRHFFVTFLVKGKNPAFNPDLGWHESSGNGISLSTEITRHCVIKTASANVGAAATGPRRPHGRLAHKKNGPASW